ncbi:N-acetyltransferase 16, like [Myripristis murdjan]|uniref:N-acetyltransferase 16, like n=1 Tax=Myripristis murdjan TaxID=586833 RepID=A0A667X1D3_9TELE|nr:probable N-acetyltransferase 16 [Myripristis murdjan]
MQRACLGQSEGLTLWLAQPDDYEDVISMSAGMHDGSDYLPHRYHSWMTEPDRVVVLARRECRLVALVSYLLVDEGATVVVQGLRVCPTDRGHGVAGVIQRFTDRYIQQLHPGVKMKRLVRGQDPGPEKLVKFKILGRRGVLSLALEAESIGSFISHLRNKLQSPVIPGLIPLNEAQVKRVFLDPKLPCRVQLPGISFIQDWVPLQRMEGNLEILKRQKITWLVDSLAAPSFLSLYTPPYPIPYNGGSLCLNIDMLGADHVLAQCALVNLLEAAWAKGELRGTVRIYVYMSKALRETLLSFCEGHQGVRTCRDLVQQLFLERQL